ncbi:NAD-aldehyde dehydrogenase [Trametes punicea]|nr:NAD-aldehyde dehydrogenase [Trametes punicea]
MSTSFYTPLDEIPKIHQRAREAYRSGKLKSIAYRKQQIAAVGYLLKDNEQRFIDAYKQDLGRPAHETIFLDFASVYIDVKAAYDNVEKWVKPERAEFHLNFFMMNPRRQADPKGVLLTIAPFNVPTLMLLVPLIGAIAGGNAAVLKPSEHSPSSAVLFAELVPQYLDTDLFHVINGGIRETQQILELRWDHILFTGSSRVGRIVAEAAGRHLTPLTLELGGKNPVVVDPKSDLKLAARRILWGRVCNAGQACLAPEYVLVLESFQDTFIEALKEVHDSFYPEGPKNSDSMCRIVSEAHTARLKRLLDETKGTIVIGGDVDISQRYVAPTVVKDVRRDDALMLEELFGPILAIVPVKDVDEAIELIREMDTPLAVYAFSQDKAFLDKVFSNTESGAAVANDLMINCGIPGLPMGGLGASGYGYYTGKHMFDEFTHIRVSLNNPGWVDKVGFGFRYPPYKPEGLKQLRALYPSLPPRPNGKKEPSRKRWGFLFAVLLVATASIVLTEPGLALLMQLKG